MPLEDIATAVSSSSNAEEIPGQQRDIKRWTVYDRLRREGIKSRIAARKVEWKVAWSAMR